MTQEIGLHDLLEQLKVELLQETPGSPKLFFVESAEIELFVNIERSGEAGINISVLSLGGLKGGGSATQQKGHKLTLKLVPLASLEEVRKQLTPAQKRRAEQGVMKGDL
jgi:hypothetical protein